MAIHVERSHKPRGKGLRNISINKINLVEKLIEKNRVLGWRGVFFNPL